MGHIQLSMKFLLAAYSPEWTGGCMGWGVLYIVQGCDLLLHTTDNDDVPPTWNLVCIDGIL